MEQAYVTYDILMIEPDSVVAHRVEAAVARANAELVFEKIVVHRLHQLAGSDVLGSVEAVLLDVSNDDDQTFERLHHAAPNLPVILISDLAHEERALQMMAQGARSYLVKDLATPILVLRSLFDVIGLQCAGAA